MDRNEIPSQGQRRRQIRNERTLRSEPAEEGLYDDLDGLDDTEHKVFGLGLLNAEDRQPAYGQGVVISLLAAAALLLLAIIAIGEGDGSDPPVFQQTDTLFWGIAAVVVILTAAGAQYAERTAANAAEVAQSRADTLQIATAWTVPFVSVVAAILLTATYHNRWMLLFGPLIAFLGTAGALLSRDLLDEADEETGRVASTIHTLVVHAVAFLAFSAVYLNKFDTWVAAPFVGIAGGLLILETLERAGIAAPTRVFYSVIGGWILAEVMIALNWWPTWGWTGGAVLLAIFYAFAGILLTFSQKRRVQTRDLIEFGGVAAVAVVILAMRDLFL